MSSTEDPASTTTPTGAPVIRDEPASSSAVPAKKRRHSSSHNKSKINRHFPPPQIPNSTPFFNRIQVQPIGPVQRQSIGGTYVHTGQIHKANRNWAEAGLVFEHAARAYMYESTKQIIEAGNCYRKVNSQKAVDCILKAAQIFVNMGDFCSAARQHATAAEIYETEMPNMEEARKHHIKAAEFYGKAAQNTTDAK